jgi:TM2 domain-containing membrane protein YozV
MGDVMSNGVPSSVRSGGVSNDARAMMLFEANKKTPVVAYLLWFFLGMLGAHNFYLKRTGVAAAQLIVTLVSIPLTAVAIGGLGLLAVFLWIIVDAFLIPGWIRNHNNLLAAQLGA